MLLGFFDKKKKVLFIEDDESVMKMYQNYFLYTKVDFNVAFASNKEQFVKYIDEVDAVVSDYHIPSLRFEEVRKRCERNKIPLLLISGDIQPYYKSQLSKPVNVKTIVSEIQKLWKEDSNSTKKVA